ncbi:MAG: ABC transporter permease [Gemmatimonadota bacterium]|nr:MAG: ABC transporter permease [Gemmatimonadota bacterium]
MSEPIQRRDLPRGIRLLLRLLPQEYRDACEGDLIEEYERYVIPSRSRRAAKVWLWRSASKGALVGFGYRLYDLFTSESGTSDGRGGRHPRMGVGQMDIVAQDLRYALRRLVASPGFTLVAIVSLGLGVGVNTALFSVVNAVLVRGPQVADPGSLVEVYSETTEELQIGVSSWPDFRDVATLTDVFDGVTAYEMFFASQNQEDGSDLVLGELVSASFFKVLGVTPVLGRGFLPSEDEVPGRDPVVVVSQAFWKGRLGGDPGVVGRTLRLNGGLYTIVGVAPEGFTGMWPALSMDVWAPSMMMDQLMAFGNEGRYERRGSQSVFIKARLRAGVPLARAQAASSALAARLLEAYPEVDERLDFTLTPTLDVSVHPLVDKALVPVAGMLMAVVGLVLLIACTNLASFLLARGADRKKEVALRLALGARRGRLVRQLLTETMLLALAGGAVGVALADWTVRLLTRFQPPLPVPISLDLSLDRTVFLFALAVSLGAGMLFGLLPALQSTKPDIAPTLKAESHRGGAGRTGRLRSGLVVTQVAVSLVLLVGSGLFLRSLIAAQAIDPGFQAPEAAMISFETRTSGYEDAEALVALRQLQERVAAVPGVDAVAAADRLPLSASLSLEDFQIPGHEPPEGREGIALDAVSVGAGYLDLLQIPILSGRGIEASDTGGSEPVLVISQAMARRFWPGEDPVGQVIRTRGRDVRIVGVVRDTKVRTLGEAPRPLAYSPLEQNYHSLVTVIARGQGPAPETLAILRGTLNEFDPNLVIMSETTMPEHLGVMLFPARMAALLLAVSGGLGVLLAAVGLYGVVSYGVSRRTHEVGVRMSLGADPGSVVGLVIGGGLRLVIWGAAIGLGLAFAVTRAVERFLYGVSATDPLTFLGVPLLLLAVATLAAYVPARRASRVDPVTALRSE